MQIRKDLAMYPQIQDILCKVKIDIADWTAFSVYDQI